MKQQNAATSDPPAEYPETSPSTPTTKSAIIPQDTAVSHFQNGFIATRNQGLPGIPVYCGEQIVNEVDFDILHGLSCDHVNSVSLCDTCKLYLAVAPALNGLSLR